MLERLHIENVAVIEQADIDFGAGLNVLTGETGAGKSMVIDSILAILGERTYRDIIRTGEKKAVVSALFSGAGDIAAEIGIDAGESGELLISREIHSDGRNVCRINSVISSLPVLRAVGSRLLSVHGQHEGQKLLAEEYHLRFLDSFANYDSLAGKYARAYGSWCDKKSQLESMLTDDREKNRLRDMLQFQIDEIDAAHLKPGEDVRLENRRKLLQSAQKITSALERALIALDGDEENSGALRLIGRAQAAFESISSIGEEISEIDGKLTDLRCLAEDVCEYVRDMHRSMDFSPDELEELENRYDVIYRLKRKYGGTVEDILAYREKCSGELDSIIFSEQKSEKLRAECDRLYEETLGLGRELTKARLAAAAELEERVTNELTGMDMTGVRFRVEIKSGNEPGPNGCDTVRFLLSANVGEELRPLARIASGGELSRIMLALQKVLTEDIDVQTLIFDEVDSGISGRAAHAVGQKLASLAKNRQVICVTHLPGIARFGSEHFLIEKGVRGGRTYTDVKKLDRSGRIREIARMTGGPEITKAALDNAAEMLETASE